MSDAMPLPAFEWLCAAIVAGTFAAMARRTPPRELAADVVALALAGLLGEASCIAAYRFYGYAPAWHLTVLEVPLLVALIWPFVILSARDVASRWTSGRARPLVVGAIVIVDASLVEVIAVRAGLWGWAEPGHLGVPLVGILGWGCFGAAADALLRLPARARRLAVVALAPLATHALLLAAWWGLLRWTLRGDLGGASVVATAVAGAALAAVALVGRAAGRGLPLEVALPRTIAAALFLAVLLRVAPDDGPLWVHVAAVSAPYLVLTIPGGRSAAGRAAATPPSPRGTGAAGPSRGAS